MVKIMENTIKMDDLGFVSIFRNTNKVEFQFSLSLMNGLGPFINLPEEPEELNSGKKLDASCFLERWLKDTYEQIDGFMSQE